jgi:hypothetical protein
LLSNSECVFISTRLALYSAVLSLPVTRTPDIGMIIAGFKTGGGGNSLRPDSLRGYIVCHSDLSPRLIDREHLERRVLGRDGADLVVAGIWPGALEERYRPLPSTF